MLKLCIFSADITTDMLKLCRVTKVKVLFLDLVYVFNFNLFEFSAAILEKGLLTLWCKLEYLVHAISHSLTSVNAQREIHGFTTELIL